MKHGNFFENRSGGLRISSGCIRNNSDGLKIVRVVSNYKTVLVVLVVLKTVGLRISSGGFRNNSGGFKMVPVV